MSYSPSTLMNGTIAAGASININFSAFAPFYTKIVVEVFDILPATNSVNLSLRTSADGTTFDSGASAYAYTQAFVNTTSVPTSGAGSAGTSSVALATGLSNTTSQGASTVKLEIYNPGGTAQYSKITYEVGIYPPVTNAPAYVYGTASRLAAQATKGVSLFMSSGNISGSYIVTGFK